MALELLAGPFPVTDVVTGATLNGTNSIHPDLIWVDPDGFVWNSTYDTYLIAMDGSAYPIGTPSGFKMPALSLLGANPNEPYGGDPWYVFHHHGIGIDGRDERIIDRVFRNSGSLVRSDHPNTDLGESVTLYDRWLTLSGANVRSTPNAATPYSTEKTIAGFSNGRCFSWARERGHLWLGGSSGHLVLYDYVNKVAASPVYRIGLTTVAGLYYSKKHDVFISIHSDGTQYLTNVWARTALPATVAAVTFNPTPVPGRVVTVTTRVTGSNGEPCVGEAVQWSATGEGVLLRSVTETDDAGYARNQVSIPMTATGPNLTVTAEIVIP